MRTALIAAALYGLLATAFVVAVPRERLWSHSPYNHYSLQAQAWLEGRLDLAGPPPRYTGNNDFAVYEGKHFVSFPPVPAALMLPFVAAAGQVERVRDAQIFLWLAPMAPVLLFFSLDRLRAAGRIARSQEDCFALAALFGLGTVYWFCAVQGSVWYGGHVVAACCLCGYLLASVEARHPLLAGLLLALGFGTRPTLALALPFFLLEARRVASGRELARLLARFAAPAAVIVGVLMWHNHARFDSVTEFGHHHLDVRWRDRIERYGLFSYRYVARNLAVMLAGLPFVTDRGIVINGHGLALWITSPIYAYALWPRRTDELFWSSAVCAVLIAALVVAYQNSGWVQFGYRFSNDFAPFLFLMMAAGRRRLGPPFWAAAAVAVAINAFGAFTFGTLEHQDRYFIDTTQRILFPTDLP